MASLRTNSVMNTDPAGDDNRIAYLTYTVAGVGYIFLAIVGQTLIEAGVARRGFHNFVLFKNTLMLSLGVIMWWLLGYGFATSKVVDFIGKWNFAGDEWQDTDHYLWATWTGFIGIYILMVIGGALTERLQMSIYLIYTFFVMAFVWPIVVAWDWGLGWLYDIEGDSFIDGGGACTVHVFAGAFAIPALIFAGRRHGKVAGGYFRPEDVNLFIFGVFLEMIGLLYFQNDMGHGLRNVGNGFFNHLLAGGASAVVASTLSIVQHRDCECHIYAGFKGLIAGFVIVSAIAQNTYPWECFVFGVIAGLLFTGIRILEEKFNIDDATMVLPAHFFPGMFGCIGVGFWDHDFGVYHNGGGNQIGLQLVGFGCITAWALLLSALIFGIKTLLFGIKVPQDVRESGFEKADYSFFRGIRLTQ